MEAYSAQQGFVAVIYPPSPLICHLTISLCFPLSPGCTDLHQPSLSFLRHCNSSLPFSKSSHTILFFFSPNTLLNWDYSFHNFLVIYILYPVSAWFPFFLSAQYLYHISRQSQRLSNVSVSGFLNLLLARGEY